MAATAVTIEIATEDNRPVEVLQDRIQQRVRILRETTRDAVVATAITALRSLRAWTRKGKKKVKVTSQKESKLSITVEEVPSLRVGFTGHDHKVCVRNLAGDRQPQIRPWLRVTPSELQNAKVYKITLSGDRVEAWPHQKLTSYMIARNLESANRCAQARFSKVTEKSSGFAKDALSRAMQLASSRKANLVSKRAAVLSSKNLVSVNKNESGFGSGTFSIEINDDLSYAAEALKGGASVVPTALAKAANSVNGYLNAFMNKHAAFFFKDQHEKEFLEPFPPDMFDPETGYLMPA